MDTKKVFSLGVLVNLKVRKWSGQASFTKEDMGALGMASDAIPDSLVSAGRKLLVSRDSLKQIAQAEMAARALLNKYGVNFPLADAHFVPFAKLPEVEEKLAELSAQFMTAAEQFIESYPNAVKCMEQAYPDFWAKCLADSYKETADSLRKRFAFRVYKFVVSGSVEFAEATNIDLDAMKKAVEDEVQQFVGNYISEMRGRVQEFCALIRDRVDGSPHGEESEAKKLTMRSVKAFRKYIEHFKTMNVFDDAEMAKVLEELDANVLARVNPTDIKAGVGLDALRVAMDTVYAQASAEGEQVSEYIGQLQRRIVL